MQAHLARCARGRDAAAKHARALVNDMDGKVALLHNALRWLLLFLEFGGSLVTFGGSLVAVGFVSLGAPCMFCEVKLFTRGIRVGERCTSACAPKHVDPRATRLVGKVAPSIKVEEIAVAVDVARQDKVGRGVLVHAALVQMIARGAAVKATFLGVRVLVAEIILLAIYGEK
jgi:hypothetical protein